MKINTHSTIAGRLLTAGTTMLTLAAPALAQEHPRTSWGEPDISGVYAEFTTAPFQRPKELGEQEFFTPEQFEANRRIRLEEVDQDDETLPGTAADVHYDMGTFALSENEGISSRNLRTSILTTPKDGRIPTMTAAAVERLEAWNAMRRGHEFDGPEMRSLNERCVIWTSTVAPILPAGYNSNLQIFQSPGYVMIQGEMGDPRIIPTDGRPLPENLVPQWNGTAVGHWEGDTLVVESTGFEPLIDSRSTWRNKTEDTVVTERFTRVDDDTVEYAFTVSDPNTWAEPWGGVYPLTEMDNILFEYACTEGNYGMANILSGERAREREAAGQQ